MPSTHVVTHASAQLRRCVSGWTPPIKPLVIVHFQSAGRKRPHCQPRVNTSSLPNPRWPSVCHHACSAGSSKPHPLSHHPQTVTRGRRQKPPIPAAKRGREHPSAGWRQYVSMPITHGQNMSSDGEPLIKRGRCTPTTHSHLEAQQPPCIQPMGNSIIEFPTGLNPWWNG